MAFLMVFLVVVVQLLLRLPLRLLLRLWMMRLQAKPPKTRRVVVAVLRLRF